MKNYEKIVVDWLNKYYVGIDLSKKSVIDDIDIMIDIKNIKNNKNALLNEGINLFKALVNVCKYNNNLLNDFVPSLVIYLGEVLSYEKNNIKSTKDIAKYMKHTPPELSLSIKNELYYNNFEKFQYPVSRKIFNLDENYYPYIYIYIYVQTMTRIAKILI